MSETSKKTIPPYVTYKSFSNFINGLRENGAPVHITRSMLPGSNSGKAAMSASLSALALVNDKEEPTEDMKQLVDASKDYSTILRLVLKKSYPFLVDGSLGLGNTTTDKVVEKMRELGAGGSTITKCIAFLLAAAADAGIAVSRYVKTPAPPTSTKKRAKHVARDEPGTEVETEEEVDEELESLVGKERIVVSVHGMDDWVIYVPEGLSDTQWKHGLKMAKFILDNYRPDASAEGS